MKVEIKIDGCCTEPKVVVVTDKVTDEINEIVKTVSGFRTSVIAGFTDGQATVLDPETIFRVYSSGGKVYAETENGEYLLRLRLYVRRNRAFRTALLREFRTAKS